MVVTTDVHQVIERSTIQTIFQAKRLHPLTGAGPTFGLYRKHCAKVPQLDLHKVDIITYHFI